MKKFILSGFIGLLAIAVAGTPLALRAQASTNATAAEKKARAEKMAGVEKKDAPKSLPFRGKVKTIDNSAKTLSVGKETFQITSETKITKMGKPATLSDGAEGDQVAGSYHKDADGKSTASMVRFGPKSPADASSNTKTNKP
jgi:hypothetical protein